MAGIGHLLVEAEMPKAASIPGAALAARPLSKGIALALGAAGVLGAGYFGHQMGLRQADKDYLDDTVGVHKPGVGTFVRGGLASFGVSRNPAVAPVGGAAGVVAGRRSYDKRMAELQARARP